jgi:integrase
LNKIVIATVAADGNKPVFEASDSFLSSVLRNSRKSKLAYKSALNHFQRFLQDKYPAFNIQSILGPLSEGKIDVYKILEEFISHTLFVNPNLTPNSIKLYMAGVRSYLAFNDIDIIPSKFKRKVRMPKLYREDEEPLDVSDIRKILLSCNNRRLKAYLLVLASSGVRAVEGLAIRLKDIDFSASPTKIHIRKEYTKTRVSRDIYISAEADLYLKQWLDWKYNNKERPRKVNPAIEPSILSQLIEAMCRYCRYANPAINRPTTTAISLITFFRAYPSSSPPKKPPPAVATTELKFPVSILYSSTCVFTPSGRPSYNA